ncbi:MAG TPA: glycosyltransferase [Gemmatimonadales bacterium]|nr:glycosyltransferase [Gemmatimonadales bacterium]
MSAHYLLTPVGSAGDVHPFVGIGRALRARGHRVTVFAAEPFRGMVERAGLEFDWFWSAEDYERTAAQPGLWHPVHGYRYLMRHLVPTMPRLYQLVESRYEPGRTVLVGHTVSFATRMFEDRHGAPAATLQLSPVAFRSDFGQPTLPGGADPTPLPRPLKRAFWAALDRFALDPPVAPALNRWGASLGLAPVRRIFKDWIHSPRRVIGLFPPWFAPPQPDWPPQLRLTGFPRWDEAGLHPPDRALEEFLAAGPAPLVFTPGSANRHGAAFFAAALVATRRLGGRALLLTPSRTQVPAELPREVHWAPYAPFSVVLPRAAAFIHHGGIGSVAQGLAAGVPQLVMPMSHDQPDHAARIRRLGVGTWLPPRRFTGARVARALAVLLESPAIRESARQRAAALHEDDPVAATCDLLEELVPGGANGR